MRIKTWFAAALVCWVVPMGLFMVTEQIYLTRLQKNSYETPVPAKEESVPTTPTQLQMLTVKMGNDTLVDMELSEYLTGVVLGEMPADFEPEALKAQAVVARTYTLKHSMSQRKHTDCAVCADPACCQAYCSPEEYLQAGHSRDKLEKVSSAVQETDQQVLYYGGELIDATYFSCAGDRTEEALAVWGTDVPYLQSVESPGEETSANYITSVSFTPDEFLLLLGETTQEPQQNWIGQITYTQGGGVDTMEICGKTYKGTQLRSLLGLRSTDFQITAASDSVIITTKGYGHRVGMSQYGAQAMALQGCGFAEILQHYYPGTVLETWQE